MAKESPQKDEPADSFIFFVRSSGSDPFSGKLKIRPGERFQIDLNRLNLNASSINSTEDSEENIDAAETASILARALDGKKIKAYPYGAGRLTLMIY